jgi:hypothetical protein
MNDTTAMAVQPAPLATQLAAPVPQGTSPQIVPLDRDSLQFYASMITMANLVPVEANVPAEVSKSRVMAKIVSGASYGFDPILAQSCYDVLFNRLVLNAHAMEILFRDSGEYDSRIIQLDDDACRVDVLQRIDGTWDVARNQYVGGKFVKVGTVEFTYDMAVAAKLPTKNANWAAFRQDMLYSKVMKRVVKRYNPTCLRPRTLLGNYFAKAHQPLAPVVPPTPDDATPPQLEQKPAPEPTSVPPIEEATYEDATYAGIGSSVVDDDDGVEAVIEETPISTESAPVTDPDESKLADMRVAVKDLLVEKIGGLASDQKTFLKGRVVDNESLDVLTKMYEELQGM